jgi:hypothetical protein
MPRNETLKVVGIFYYPWEDSYVKTGDPNRTLLALYKKMIWYKANPRSKDYMENLFIQRYPDGEFLHVHNSSDIDVIRNKINICDKVVLLFPDAIGLGCYSIEKILFGIAPPHLSIRILNGRKRDFNYSLNVKYSLKLRRLFSRALIVEFALMPIMLFLTLVYLPLDFLRGKK